MGDHDELHFGQQFIARVQAQQENEDEEAERAWQAALAAQGGGGGGGSSLGSGLLNPKKVGGNQSPVPPSLAGLYTPPSQLSPEEEEEEAERAWREALALQGGDDMDDEDAERAWREALEAQQEELDLKDDEYYEELYRNTRINEGNKVSLEKEIQELNEQRWKLRDKKSEYYSGMKELMESSKALDVLRQSTNKGVGGRPLKGILKRRLERVQIDRRLTLRMARTPLKDGKRKRVGFILPEELSSQEAEELIRKKNREVEKILSSKPNIDDNEEEFLEMSLQFIQDFKEEEERLKAESEEIKRMEEQVARLEAELAREGIALAEKAGTTQVVAITPQPKQQPDAVMDDAKNPHLPARVKRGTKGFGGVFIDEVHKMLGKDELQKIEERIAHIPEEDAEDAAAEGDDEEDEDNKAEMAKAADANLPARIKRGTKGFGGVFIEQVHKLLEDDKAAEQLMAAKGAAPAPGAKPGPAKTAPGTPPVSKRPPIPAKPGPADSPTKPGPPQGVKALQLAKINKEEQDRRAAELAAKKEEDERKNQERLKQAAEARKTLASPRPATLPSPRGTTPTTPAPTTAPSTTKPAPSASPRPVTTSPTANSTKPAPPNRNTPTPQAAAGTKPAPTSATPSPRPTPPVRPDRSPSDPISKPAAPNGNGSPRPASPSTTLNGSAHSSTGKLEVKQPPQAGRGGSTSPQPALRGSPGSPTGGGAKPGPLGAVTSPRRSESEIIRRPPRTDLATPATNGAKPQPGASPRGGRGAPLIKPLNHPEPVKRGVARPNNIDPTISAKANFFEQKQQQNTLDPAEEEKIVQRRARLDVFTNKVLAKTSAENLKSPRVN